jgi:hypothetical protein
VNKIQELIGPALDSNRAIRYFRHLLRTRDWAAMAPATLSILSNVESLEIRIMSRAVTHRPSYNPQPLLIAPLNLLNFQYPFSSKISSLKITNMGFMGYEATSRHDSLTAIPVSFFELPSLRSFSGTGISQSEDLKMHWDARGETDPRFHLQNLELNDCSIHGDSIGEFLRACSDLKSLTYDHVRHKFGSDSFNTRQGHQCSRTSTFNQFFVPETFGQMIKPMKDGLEELTLFRTYYCSPNQWVHNLNGDHQEFGILTALKDFTRLHSIRISADLLLGAQKIYGCNWYQLQTKYLHLRKPLEYLLPSSLKHLTLESCGCGIFRDLVPFINEKEKNFTLLKTLRLEFIAWRKDVLWENNINSQLANGDIVLNETEFDYKLNRHSLTFLEELCTRKGIKLEVKYFWVCIRRERDVDYEYPTHKKFKVDGKYFFDDNSPN